MLHHDNLAGLCWTSTVLRDVDTLGLRGQHEHRAAAQEFGWPDVKDGWASGHEQHLCEKLVAIKTCHQQC